MKIGDEVDDRGEQRDDEFKAKAAESMGSTSADEDDEINRLANSAVDTGMTTSGTGSDSEQSSTAERLSEKLNMTDDELSAMSSEELEQASEKLQQLESALDEEQGR